jgi:macrodomain Ter protein organizer (MatP/YcbG family)
MARVTLDLLKGIKHTETVKIDYRGQLLEFEVKPLNHNIATKIQKILGQHIENRVRGRNKKTLDAEVTMNTGQAIEGKYQAWLQATLHGLVDPQLTEAEILEQLLPQWIEQIGQHVMVISGIEEPTEEDEELAANSFREADSK